MLKKKKKTFSFPSRTTSLVIIITMNTHIGLPLVDCIEKSLQSLIKGKVRRIHHFYKKKIEDLTTTYEKKLSDLTRQIEVISRNSGNTSAVNRFDIFDEKQKVAQQREKEQRDREQREREEREKEQRDREQREREQREREQREKEQRDLEKREKCDREQRDREQRDREQREKCDREQREKQQRDREQREKQQRDRVTHTFPIELKDWCDRSFAKCNSETEKSEMEIHLRNIISESIHNGTVGTKKWANQPIPSLTSYGSNCQRRCGDSGGDGRNFVRKT